MISRYTRPEMGALWTEEAKYASWLEVELAVCEAMAARGRVPAEAARRLRRSAGFDVARIEEIEKRTRHDVIAFLSAVAERAGEDARHLHLGLTSSDVLDTAMALRLRKACDLIIAGLERVMLSLRRRALEHRRTPMIGRTHGVHAEPTTLGLKLALWYDLTGRARGRLERAREAVSVGKISGAVGTYAQVEPGVEEEACRRLGLRAARVSSQIVPRDGYAELMSAIANAGAAVELGAVEIRSLQRTEIRELEEPFEEGQKGSSAMPHKRNPVQCEQLCGLSRLLRSYSHVALENVALWNERDISHSSAERVILPDATITLDYMLDRWAWVIDGMRVHPENMRRNLETGGGLVYSGQVLTALARKGVARDTAYGWVQRQAMKVWNEGGSFRDAAAADPDIKRTLSAAELGACFDLSPHLKHVDAIFARVFGEQPVRRGASRPPAPERARPSRSTAAADSSPAGTRAAASGNGRQRAAGARTAASRAGRTRPAARRKLAARGGRAQKRED